MKAIRAYVPSKIKRRYDYHPDLPDKRDHYLQFILLFSRDPNLPILQLVLHFEATGLDRLNDLLRLLPFEALLNFQFLPRVAH